MQNNIKKMHKTVIDKRETLRYNTFGDYMKYDLTVVQSENLYYLEQENWKRDFCTPRTYDAVVLFTQGEIEYCFGDKTFVAKKGDLCLFPGNVAYSGKRHTEKVGFFVLDFKCLCVNDFEKFGAPAVFPAENYEELYAEFSRIYSLWKKNTAQAQLELKSFLYSLFCRISSQNTNEEKSTIFEKILAYIAENISNADLSVKSLCKVFYISESSLRRSFHKNIGKSPNDYILALRINKAKGELLNTSKNIKDISFDCGFSSPYYFSRCFANIVGISPTKYRTLTLI